jgi:hypothetical protein
MGVQMSQQEAGYDPLGAIKNGGTKGCANCRWFIEPGACLVVSGEITPTGVSNQWVAEPAEGTPEDDMEDMMSGEASLDSGEKDAWTTAYKNDLPDSSFLYIEPGGSKDGDGKTTPRSLRHFPVKDASGTVDSAHVTAATRLIPKSSVSESAKSSALAKAKKMAGSGGKSLVGDIVGRIKEMVGVEERPAVWSLKEMPDGRLRFFCTPTNCFQDKEGDIFSTKSHEGFIAWADRKEIYPELWVWHTPGTRFGQVDWMDVNNGVLVASGLVDVGSEDIARSFKANDGMSHGYLYADKSAAGIIDQYWSYELSVLPRKWAANEPTAFDLTEGLEMAFNKDKKAYLKDHLGVGDDTIATWEQGSEALSKSLKDLGIAWKSTDEEETVAAEQETAATIETTLGNVVREQQNIITALGALTNELVSTKQLAQSASKSLDEAVAANMASGVSQLAAGARASESESNVVSTEEAKPSTEWLDNIFSTMQGSIR